MDILIIQRIQGKTMKRFGSVLLLTAWVLAGCGGPRTYAENEDFQTDSRHRQDFTATAEPACEAARHVLLGDGYLIVEDGGLNLVGAKEFQIDEKSHAILRVYVTCARRNEGSSLFVTATEEHFDVKTSRQSSSIGVPLISPISIGRKSETDGQVKTLGETIREKDFYEHFYGAVKRELAR
jgi:hypothetical protein